MEINVAHLIYFIWVIYINIRWFRPDKGRKRGLHEGSFVFSLMVTTNLTFIALVIILSIRITLFTI